MVYRNGVATLNDLKTTITFNVQSIPTDQLRSFVEYTVHQLEILQVNEDSHMEYFSLHCSEYD